MVFISLNHHCKMLKSILSLENKYVTASQENIFLKKNMCPFDIMGNLQHMVMSCVYTTQTLPHKNCHIS